MDTPVASQSSGTDRVLAVMIALVGVALLTVVYLPMLAPKAAAILGVSNTENDLKVASRDIQFGGRERAEPLVLRSLGKAPLDQHAVYLLYRLADAGTLRGVPSGKILPVLRQLGWKDTDAQIVLLLEAEQAGDYNQVVQRADALLRRQPASRDVHDLLYDLEALPKARDAMADRMRNAPPWRGYFFRFFRPQSREDVLNHFALLQEMASKGNGANPAEIAVAVNEAVDAGEIDTAYAFWKGSKRWAGRSAAQQNGQSGGVVDPASISYFDWNAKAGVGQSFYQAGVDSASSVGVEWNGRGSPLLLTRVMAAPVRRGYLKVVLEAGADTIDRFQLQFRCGRWIEPLDLQPTGKSGAYRSQIVDRAMFECAYPTLEVAGTPQPVDRPASVTFKTIELVDIN